MALSSELQELKEKQTSYVPSTIVSQSLAGKTLIAVIGPTAIGKSTTIEKVVEIGGSEFTAVDSYVTRPRRDDDPLGYVTADEGFTLPYAIDLINNQAVANYAIHPSGNIYATLPESFPTEYNLLPHLPESLPATRKIGFGTLHIVYLVATADGYKKQLPSRDGDHAFNARLSEAHSSIEWALRHQDELSFVENIHGNETASANTIISLLKAPQLPNEKDHGITLARAMLATLSQYTSRKLDN